MDYVIRALVMGVIATLVMDAWAIARRWQFDVPLPDYSLVGRWIGNMYYGRFVHHSIKLAAPLRMERLLGWSVHYGTGVVFAAMLLWLVNEQGPGAPSLAAAVGVGVATVAAPFLLMQPGMGLGIASSRTANPAKARAQSLATHTVFGLGLYLAGWVLHIIG